jgi:hypothetical protein
MKKNHRKLLNQLSISQGSFTTQTFSENLKLYKSIFSPEELIAHFPPRGFIFVESFDHLLGIHYQNKLIGYYKVSIFDFSKEIELHAGIVQLNPFLNRSYFVLTKKFVSEISKQFHGYQISLWVDQSNKKILCLLDFLGFEKTEEFTLNKQYINYKFYTIPT